MNKFLENYAQGGAISIDWDSKCSCGAHSFTSKHTPIALD